MSYYISQLIVFSLLYRYFMLHDFGVAHLLLWQGGKRAPVGHEDEEQSYSEEF